MNISPGDAGNSSATSTMAIQNSEAMPAIIGGSKDQIRGRFEGQDTIGLKMDNTTRRQCAIILTSLMKHPVGWVFNHPVDPVKLKIPDYFSIISKPMDLGTIKCKLERREYSSTLQFASDVRLTFSNAMRYNPPGNDVHIMAKELSNIFLSRWKSLEDKWRKARKNLNQAEMKSAQRQTITSRQVMQQKSISSSTVKRKCVEASLQGPCEGSNRIKLRIVSIHDDALAVSIQDKALAATSACTNDSDVNTCSHQCDCSQASSSDIDSERSSGSGRDQGPRGGFVPDLVHKNNSIGIAVLEDNAQTIRQPASSPDDFLQQEQLSPTKALRAAKLKSRFADTIVKARQKMFSYNGKNVDGEKIQRERERLEKQQREEKARIEAQVRAAEAAAAAATAARMRVETQMIMQRTRERQAARLALQKMEKTVDFDENIQIMKELESLCYAQPGYFLGIPDGMAMNSMDGLKLQYGLCNPLEKLGLFIKDDDMDFEATVAGNGDIEEGEISWIAAVGNGDMEEGEINCL